MLTIGTSGKNFVLVAENSHFCINEEGIVIPSSYGLCMFSEVFKDKEQLITCLQAISKYCHKDKKGFLLATQDLVYCSSSMRFELKKLDSNILEEILKKLP
jgi:hypothetical protein